MAQAMLLTPVRGIRVSAVLRSDEPESAVATMLSSLEQLAAAAAMQMRAAQEAETNNNVVGKPAQDAEDDDDDDRPGLQVVEEPDGDEASSSVPVALGAEAFPNLAQATVVTAAQMGASSQPAASLPSADSLNLLLSSGLGALPTMAQPTFASAAASQSLQSQSLQAQAAQRALAASLLSSAGTQLEGYTIRAPTNVKEQRELKAELGEVKAECGGPVEEGAFVTGAKFASFAEFEAAFEAWKSTNFHPFRVASSETLRLPDGSTNEVFKYRYIVYHCAHYGAPRMRGAGKRPNQNYLPCGCRAMLRLNFGWAENALRITTLNPRHTGHVVDAESFQKFKVKVRRPTATPPPAKVARSLASRNSSASPAASSPVSPAAFPQGANLAALHRQLAASFAAAASSAVSAASLVPLPSPASPAMPVASQMFPAASVSSASPASFSVKSEASAASTATLPQPSPHSDQENENPLDLRTERDPRSDEERFAAMHSSLQALTDHLLGCRGPDFDAKLRHLNSVLKAWDHQARSV